MLGTDTLQVEHLTLLVYTHSVLDEVIRFYPAIPPIVRQARRSEVGGDPYVLRLATSNLNSQLGRISLPPRDGLWIMLERRDGGNQ